LFKIRLVRVAGNTFCGVDARTMMVPAKWYGQKMRSRLCFAFHMMGFTRTEDPNLVMADNTSLLADEIHPFLFFFGRSATFHGSMRNPKYRIMNKASRHTILNHIHTT